MPSASVQIVFKELYSQFKTPLISFDQAAPLLNLKSKNAANMAVHRGIFPVPVRRFGEKKLVSLLDVAAFACGEEIKTGPGCEDPNPYKKQGRPTKAEQLEAARAGVTVGELRRARREASHA